MTMSQDDTRQRLRACLPRASEDAPLKALAAALDGCPAPELAISRLESLCLAPRADEIILQGLERDPAAMAEILVGVLSQSAYLTQVLERDPSLLAWLDERQTIRFTTSREIYREELSGLLAPLGDNLDQVGTALRCFQHRESFRIGVRDVLDIADIYTTALELSFLADVCIEAAYQTALANAQAQYGKPRLEQGDEISMAVLGLGKLGGEELNFSSDVDLVFVTGGDGQTGGEDDVPGARAVENERFFTRVARDVIALLSHPTGDGIAYRVDVRLRPEGAGGSLVRSLSAAETYFEVFGADWERQALLKARVVAGDLQLGRAFLRIVQPFTYRKYVDEVEISETLYSIREMRLKTFAKYEDPDELERDVKNRHGGIRDIEFTVQAIQMLYGGSYPEIRLPSTFRSLERIHQSGLLAAADYRTLRGAYEFLRRLEHRLQMEASSQTYTIPKDTQRRELLARRLGFSDTAAFQETFEKHTQGVRAIFDAIFFKEHLQDDVDVLLTTELTPETYEAVLSKYSLSGWREVTASLWRLCEDDQAPHLNSKLRRLLRGLLPRMLTCVRDCPDSSLAFHNLERIIRSEAANARVAFFTALRENPDTLAMLVAIAGSSRYLTELMVGSPARMERLLSHDHTEPLESIEAARQRLDAFHPSYEAPPGSEESETLWKLRQWNSWERLRDGVDYLLGLVDSEASFRHLSTLAECVLTVVLDDHVERLARELGLPEMSSADFGLTIIALGKFGGRECTFGSDLDVVFVHDGVPDWYHDDLPLSLQEIHTRCAQRLLKTMSATMVPGGVLYPTDARLRPYGANSPLVLSLEGYRNHYRDKIEVWERLMLTRTRFVCGDPHCGRAFEQLAQDAVTREWNDDTRQAVLDMRSRIETAKPNDPIKAGYGGLVDVEFLAQAAQLRLGREHPDILRPSTIATLEALKRADLDLPIELDPVIEAYRFLRELEMALRVVDNVSLDAFPTDPDALESLVRRIHLPKKQPPPSSEALLEDYRHRTRIIRSAFETFIASL